MKKPATKKKANDKKSTKKSVSVTQSPTKLKPGKNNLGQKIAPPKPSTKSTKAKKGRVDDDFPPASRKKARIETNDLDSDMDDTNRA